MVVVEDVVETVP